MTKMIKDKKRKNPSKNQPGILLGMSLKKKRRLPRKRLKK